ncbi:Crp/Fnr family transcriptional regulator [Niveispirillum fermenti]|uniref:Crp/Fnr family transcriptional regulator n=1 Tax=Niveispirillum fermenti TaxID=1233113 RepID=UPI003A84C895
MAEGILNRKFIKAGTQLFATGDRGEHMYLVQSGRIRLWRGEPDHPVVLAEVGPNCLFGEMALIDEGTRSACAHAVEDTTLIVISGEKVRQRLSEADPFVASIVRILARNLRASNGHLEDLMGQMLAVSAIKAREIAPNEDVATLNSELSKG